VPEWVDVPSNSRLVIELFEEELVADHHIVDHVVEVGAGFVVHGPASVDELEAVLLDELAHLVLARLRLPVEPH